MNRRGFLTGILAAGAAPWVCTKAGVLMPPRHVIQPATNLAIGRLADLEAMMLRGEIDRVVNPPLVYGRSLVAEFQAECMRLESMGWVEVAPMPAPRVRARAFGAKP